MKKCEKCGCEIHSVSYYGLCSDCYYEEQDYWAEVDEAFSSDMGQCSLCGRLESLEDLKDGLCFNCSRKIQREPEEPVVLIKDYVDVIVWLIFIMLIMGIIAVLYFIILPALSLVLN